MNLLTILITLPILIFSSILHEIAHGYVADRLGDPTARLMGRLTLNPLKHVDPLWSLLIPLLLIIGHSPVIIGGAKPVPIDPFNLKDGKKDIALVSLVGPLTNLLIAIVASVLFKLFLHGNASLSILGLILYQVVWLNLLLAVFNLIPIPPLDGSKVLAAILPDDIADQYLSIGTVGIVLIFFLLWMPIGGFSLGGFIVNILTFLMSLLGVPLL